MREMAATWNATPTAKRLPTFFEWAAMRWYVASTHWTAPEKKMMHAVQSRLRKAGTISLVVASVAGAFSYYTYCDMKSQTFATRLIEADTGDVSAILREMEPYRNWTLPKLAKWPSSIDTEDEQTTSRRKLHLELAQLGSDPENVTNLLRQLHVIDDRHIGSIIQYLKSSPTLDDSLVAKELRSATIEKSQSALPIAALLAQRVPDHPEWPTYASSLSDALIKRRGAQLGNWIELLLPIRNHLLPAILSQGESADEDNQKIDNLTTIAAAFAFDDPASLGKAITWAPIEQIPELIKNNPTREKLAVVLREILTTNTNPIPSQHRMVSPAALAILDRYNGQAIGSAAWMYRVPWSEVQPTLKQLQPDGFQPVSIRPYQSDASRFACIALQRGQAKILFEDGLSEENFHSRFQERQDQGAELIDFAEYPEILNASTADHARSTAPPKYLWAGLWRFRESESESTTQYLRLNETFPQASMGEFKSNGYIPSRYATRLNASGDLLHSCVWTRQDMENSQFNIWSRFEYASGDLFPGCYQCDLRSEPIEHGVDRSEIWTDYYQLLDDIGPSRRPSPRETVNLASRLSAVGQYQNALQLLETFTDADYANDPKGKAAVLRGAKRQYARAFARQKDSGKLKEWLASADQFGPFDPSEIHYLEFRLAVIEQSGTTAKEKLDSLLSITDTSPLVEDFCLRALAIAAQSSLPELQNASAFEKLLQRIPIAIAESKIKEIQITLMEVEFDGLMHRPEWRSLLEKLQLTSRFTNSNYARAEAVSKTIFSLPQLDHAIESQKLANQGYIPTSIHAYPNNQGNLVISSAWELLETNNAIRGKTSRQNGTIALALAKIGERDALLDALQGKWGRATQSFVVTQAHKILPPEPFVTLLKESTSAKLLPTLVSVVGSYRPNEMNESTLQYLKLRLSEWANTANDAALMAQSRWCLSQWGEPAGELQPSSTAQPERNWLVTKHGHQLVVLKPPKMVLVGEDLWRMWKRMDRNFAIGTTEVTGKQYAEFLSDPRVQKWISQERTERASPLSPPTYAQSGVSWQHAIRYCQWLNELEGVPEDQWCYKDVWNEEGLPITPYPNYTSRLGYRLPTGAEWEYACSAGSDASWHFGSDGQLAKHFEWTSPHAGNQPHEVATLRPNAFGLFDMGGNLAEWTDDFYLPPKRASNQYFTYDSGNKPTDDGTYCNLRTARFNLLPQSSTSFAFRKTLSSYLTGSTGFRIARTILTDD
jgi:formylglycine-generating enzyme required for sulfatase activity